MPNVFQTSAAVLGSALKGCVGQEVTYTRVNLSVTLTAIPRKVDYEVDDSDGIPRQVTFFDWDFVADDLVFDGDDEQIQGEHGDRITVTIGGNDYTYEAMPVGKRPVMEWLDSLGILKTVHTKLVRLVPSA